MTMKILTLISIWYVFYFMLVVIILIGTKKDKVLPKICVKWFGWKIDLLGNNIYLFMFSFMFLVWNYIVK